MNRVVVYKVANSIPPHTLSLPLSEIPHIVISLPVVLLNKTVFIITKPRDVRSIF